MKASELVLAPDGSLYHIRLTSSTLADKVLLVGDPSRVDIFKDIFESIEFESYNRELHALTGCYHGTRLTALSTGMGCDNIDIVMTELDAAANIDLGASRHQDTKTASATSSPDVPWCAVGSADKSRHLQIVRIGTCGSLQPDIDCGNPVASAYAIGLDGLMNYYREWDTPLPGMEQAFANHMQLSPRLADPYCVQGSQLLLDKIADGMHHGITATAPGFYGPQGRTIRLHPSIDQLNEKLASFEWSTSLDASKSRSLRITNLEMETSAIYGFSHLMGHEALTVCLIIANRPKGTFLNEYHPQMRQLVGSVVERLASIS